MEHVTTDFTDMIGIGILTLIGWFTNRVTRKMDDIHDDIKDLAINHGERITRLESRAHWHRRTDDEHTAID